MWQELVLCDGTWMCDQPGATAAVKSPWPWRTHRGKGRDGGWFSRDGGTNQIWHTADVEVLRTAGITGWAEEMLEVFCSLPALVSLCGTSSPRKYPVGSHEGTEPLQIWGGEQWLALKIFPDVGGGLWYQNRGQKWV